MRQNHGGLVVVIHRLGDVPLVVVHVGQGHQAVRLLVPSLQRAFHHQCLVQEGERLRKVTRFPVTATDGITENGHAAAVLSRLRLVQCFKEELQGAYIITALVSEPAQIAQCGCRTLWIPDPREQGQGLMHMDLGAVQITLHKRQPAQAVVRISNGLRMLDPSRKRQGLFSRQLRTVRVGIDQVEADLRQQA